RVTGKTSRTREAVADRRAGWNRVGGRPGRRRWLRRRYLQHLLLTRRLRRLSRPLGLRRRRGGAVLRGRRTVRAVVGPRRVVPSRRRLVAARRNRLCGGFRVPGRGLRVIGRLARRSVRRR